MRDATPDNVKILPVKALNENGSGTYSILMAAVCYAMEQGADVVSMSFGHTIGYANQMDNESDQLLHDDVRQAAQTYDAVLVAAAGNDGTNCDGLIYPASMQEVIAVSSVNQFGRLSSFSSYGNYIEIAAPGESIVSSVTGGGYEAYSGTSMAAPLVATCAALLRTENPALTAEQTRQLLHEHVRDCVVPGRDAFFGYGIVSMCPTLTGLTSISFPAKEIKMNIHSIQGAAASDAAVPCGIV